MTFIRRALAVSIVPLCGAMLLASGAAQAGGFALNEMSASSVGNAHAGGAAAAEDLGTLYFNPAGLTRLPGRQFMAAGSLIRLSAEFANAGSTVAGGSGGDVGDWALVPALYYAMDLRPDLKFGIGMHAPFGLKTEYDADWAGRYQALKSELKTINLNPTLAYRVNSQLSVGAGVSAQYADVEISRAINLGALTGGAIPRDGRVTIAGDDWGFGFNAGLLFELSERARVGLSYRSRIRHELKGDATFDVPAGLPPVLAGALANTGARASVDLPEMLNLSGYMDLDARWSVMGDVNWTRWNRFEELRVRFDNGAPDSVTPENWRNTYRVSVGANYRYNDAWKLRSGIAYDRSPVPDEFRTPRIPDTHRIWLAFGAQYKPTRNGTLDLGFAHLFVKDAPINKAEPPLGGTLAGEYDSDVNILSVQYSHAF